MNNEKWVDAVVGFFETITLESVEQFPVYYAEDAYFKDPFNEARGLPTIQRIFLHMFKQVSEPCFIVLDRVVDESGAMLAWELRFRARFGARIAAQVIRGVSHLKFDASGRVCWHRDYWDAAEELYAKLPVIGAVVRGLKRMLAS